MKTQIIISLFITFSGFAQPNESRIQQLRSDTKVDSQDRAVITLLEEFYTQALQSELGALNAETSKKMNKLYQSRKTRNRHLLLMFMAYQDHISKTAAIGKPSNTKFQVEIMTDLAHEFKTIFNEIPAIIYIYKFEALDTSGKKEEAANVLNEGLSEYPDSVPLKIYKFLSSKDEAIKIDLINNHPNHWMVKQFEINKI
ncbi:hypothetical protein [Flavobacterium sp.]